MQEDIQHRSVVLVTHTAKLTARELAKLMRAALRKLKQHHARARASPEQGKQSVRQLAKGGSLQSIPIGDDNIKAFQPVARKYGVTYALKRDTTEPKRWLVFFRAKDVDALTAAFNEFSAKTLAKAQKPSVRATMQKVHEAAKSTDHEKTRQRQREGPQL